MSLTRFRKTAARLRANSTDAEQRLWFELRKLPLYGSHFRRQVPLGPYVVDFACMKAKLVIEVDGGQHGQPEKAEQDALRTRWLQSEGYRVMRFWNNDVLRHPIEVTEMIFESIVDLSSPDPAATLRVASTLPLKGRVRSTVAKQKPDA